MRCCLISLVRGAAWACRHVIESAAEDGLPVSKDDDLFKLLVQGNFGCFTWPDVGLKKGEEVLTDP